MAAIVMLMQGMASLISWWSLTGERPALSDVHATLSRYDMAGVLGGLARISVKLRTWENSPTPEADREMVASLFPPAWIRRIDQQRLRAPNSLVFHRITLLFLVKEALQQCPAGGLAVTGAPDVFALSECFLRANDLVLGYTPTAGDSLDQLMAGLLPFYELIPQEAFPEDLVRNLFLFDNVLPTLRSDHRYIDFPSLFAGRVKMPYRRYCELALAVNAKPMLAEKLGGLLGEDFFLSRTCFSKMSVNSADVEQFLALISMDHGDLRRALQTTTLPTDVSPIQRRPLLRLEERFLVLDTAFLLDKAGVGVFWALREFLTPEEAKRAFEFLGILLEKYAHWFWETAYQGTGTYTPNTRFPDNDEAFDAILMERGTLVAIEYKSGMLAAEAKHSFAADMITDAIDRKYVTSQRGERKGIAQLRRGIERFLRGEPLGKAPLTREHIHTIHPVIIAADPALTGPLVSRYLDRKLDRRSLRSKGRHIAVAPLQLATFADIERLLPYTSSVSVTEILEAANKEAFPSGNLRQRARTAIFGVKPGRDPVKEAWEALASEMLALLSPP